MVAPIGPAWYELPHTVISDKYAVSYNFVKGTRSFGELESITFTTQGDYRFLDNLEPLLERWQGPISMTMFAPGTDFNSTVELIKYYRHCAPQSQLIRVLTSIHLFYPLEHLPDTIHGIDPYEVPHSCRMPW